MVFGGLFVLGSGFLCNAQNSKLATPVTILAPNTGTELGKLDFQDTFGGAGTNRTGILYVTHQQGISNTQDPGGWRLAYTNIPGNRQFGAMGFIETSASTGADYEQAGIAGFVVSDSEIVNGVAVSGFIGANHDGPHGTVNVAGDGITVTWVSGDTFNCGWAGINNAITINNTNTGVATCGGPHNLVLTSSVGGPRTGVVYYKQIVQWGTNTLCTDGKPGAGGTPSYQYIRCIGNENDANYFNALSQGLAYSFGGNSGLQPFQLLGMTCNTPGVGIKHDYCFGSQDGVTSVYESIGVSSTGNNANSQISLVYGRDSSGNAHGTARFTSPSGDWVERLNFVHAGPSTNPQYVWFDGAGTLIAGLIGGVSGARPEFQMAGDGSMAVGSNTLANIAGIGLSAGHFMWCSNCQGVLDGAVAGNVCTVAGTHGAWAFGSVAAIVCF